MHRSLKPVQKGLLYLTYHENVLRTGILHTQVVRMLQKLGELGSLKKIVLLSFLSPQSLWKDRQRIPQFKQTMAESGVTVVLLPMLFPAKWSYPASLLIFLWAVPTYFVALFTGCRIVHSRGYPAALLARTVSHFLDLRTVFDPRGPYPDEMVMNSIWEKGSYTELFWKSFESMLISNSDAVIGVTSEFRDEFLHRGAKRSIFVPNRTDVSAFGEGREAFRLQGQSRDGVEMLFIGELHSVWNDPGLVGRHFIGLSRQFPEARLRLITTANPQKALETLESGGVDITRVTFESRRPAEMPFAMQGATFGLIFRAVNIHSLWSVKIAEYLAAGIPLIVDKTMVGLPVKIIREKLLGVVIDPDNPADYEQLDQIVKDWPEWSERCVRYAERRLDLRSTARQHLRLYRSFT